MKDSERKKLVQELADELERRKLVDAVSPHIHYVDRYIPVYQPQPVYGPVPYYWNQPAMGTAGIGVDFTITGGEAFGALTAGFPE